MSSDIFSGRSRRNFWQNRVLEGAIEGNLEETSGGILYKADFFFIIIIIYSLFASSDSCLNEGGGKSLLELAMKSDCQSPKGIKTPYLFDKHYRD